VEPLSVNFWPEVFTKPVALGVAEDEVLLVDDEVLLVDDDVLLVDEVDEVLEVDVDDAVLELLRH
jgi:hypothetical protein